MKLSIFVRFHAKQGQEAALVKALAEIVAPTRLEPGCVLIDAHRAIGDSRVFFIHSIWVDDAAFERHATLPHTRRFIEIVTDLLDHPMDVTRARAMEP